MGSITSLKIAVKIFLNRAQKKQTNKGHKAKSYVASGPRCPSVGYHHKKTVNVSESINRSTIEKKWTLAKES